jgi:hypothetical protein
MMKPDMVSPFARSYTLARQIQIEALMDESLEIADDSSNDWIDAEGPDGKKYRVFNPDSVRQSKLRIGGSQVACLQTNAEEIQLEVGSTAKRARDYE